MPNFKTHRNVGLVAGTLIALTESSIKQDLKLPVLISNILVGAIGGAIGGILPDILEPPCHPNHRNIAHSYLAAGAMVWSVFQDLHRKPYCPSNRNVLEIFSIATKTGYSLHLILDSSTPKRLPLLVR